MTPERSRQLNSPESGTLTPEEMRGGWHFCNDWDGLLVNVNDTEGEGVCCTCGPWSEAEIEAAHPSDAARASKEQPAGAEGQTL